MSCHVMSYVIPLSMVGEPPEIGFLISTVVHERIQREGSRGGGGTGALQG